MSAFVSSSANIISANLRIGENSQEYVFAAILVQTRWSKLLQKNVCASLLFIPAGLRFLKEKWIVNYIILLLLFRIINTIRDKFIVIG